MVDEAADDRGQGKQPVTDRESGSIGCAARLSRQTKSTERTADVTNAASRAGCSQPSAPPSMIAPASVPSAPIAASWPGRSSSREPARVVSLA